MNTPHIPPAAATSQSADAIAIERKNAAYAIGAATGHDWRTALRALNEGLGSIKAVRVREALRPHVMAYLAGRRP